MPAIYLLFSLKIPGTKRKGTYTPKPSPPRAPTAAMADELDELIDFLSDSNPQVRDAAVDIVRGLTGGDDGLQLLASAGGSKPGEAAADSLVNLSQDAALAARLVALGAVAAAMDVMAKRGGEQPGLARSLVVLLVNLTHAESGVAALLQVGDEKVQGLYVAKLVRSFCRSSSDSEVACLRAIAMEQSRNGGGKVVTYEEAMLGRRWSSSLSTYLEIGPGVDGGVAGAPAGHGQPAA